jgi:NADPH2:quinone reductase
VFDASRKCIAFEGRIVVVGFTSGRIPQVPANHVLVKNYSVVGLHWGLYRSHDPARIGMVHEELCRLFADGAVDPLVGQVLPMAQLPAAMAAIADRGTVGKVVLRP